MEPNRPYPQIITEVPRVPNTFPTKELEPGDPRIAIIGEAPGEEEEAVRVPFFGKSGRYLNGKLREVGIDREKCFVGNITQFRPPGNKIALFQWTGAEIQKGLKWLEEDLRTFNPTICVLLGNTPLHAAKANTPVKPTKDGAAYPFKVTSWRGSLFKGLLPGPFLGRKCISSIHPAAVLREFSWNPLLGFDLNRAREEAFSNDIVLPQRTILTNLDAATLCYLMDNWTPGQLCSVDLEGGLPPNKVNESVKKDSKKRRHLNWRCVSLSASPLKAIVISWWKFNEDDHVRVLGSFARLMWREDVPKLLQNALYDAFVQTFGYGIPIRNIAEDTMVKGWELYSELPKSLSVQASIWTREPHWKDEEMYETTGENLAIGCGKDTCVTMEISIAQDAALDPNQNAGPVDEVERRKALAHCRANTSMLQPLLYMELRGMKYDTENVQKQLKEKRAEIAGIGERLCQLAGVELRGTKGSLSSQRLAKLLYETKGYPPQFTKEAGRKTETLTTNVEALLSLRKRLPEDELLTKILEHRHLEGIIETLEIKPDPDGRVRCGYNVVGTETGRLTCYTSPTGAGANLTTITKDLRLNYTSDPGRDFGQWDLSGADGWTVAAHTRKFNDPTMWDDYRFGLKPAKITALLYAFGEAVNKLDRESLAFWSREDKKNKDAPFDIVGQEVGTSIYDCCKVVQHGSNYGMLVPTMQVNVMKKSYKFSGKAIYMDFRTGTALRYFYFLRYPGLTTWHQWAEAQLVAHRKLTSASGHTRHFFGALYGPRLQETVREFLADEPQQNTTWATNLAMLNLWNDPENRYKGLVLKDAYETWIATLEGKPGALFIEPLHQVHDALCTQSPSTHRPWTGRKIKQWFNNELHIADSDLVIPFEGGLGPNWGNTPHKI